MSDKNPKPSFDLVGNIIAFENGELDSESVIALFQELVNSGMAWTLQGSYGRQAELMIQEGLITDRRR